VLDLTGELSEARPFRDHPRVTYLNLPVLDLTAPPDVVLREATDFIAGQRAAGHTVYVHCKAGYSRSAAVVAAHLLRTGAARTAEEALATIRAVRPRIIVRPEAAAAVERFAGEPAGAGRVAIGA
jgi:protein phosphatase